MLVGIIDLAAYGGSLWLREHPEYDPRAPLTIDQADTSVTRGNVMGVRDDRNVCRAFLKRSDIAIAALEPAGSGDCRRDDRKRLAAPARLDIALRPSGAHLCRLRALAPSRCAAYGEAGSAIDIAAFVLSDGRRVTVLRDWSGKTAKATFLHTVRDHACTSFSTVLSPDYNAAHADHLHLDQARRRSGWSSCR
ncbi:hypothetical protein LH128_15511 [Sphingomonas sp. LH128]|uniref:extensin-like domain-containing protein n=1 Tax=Sphingomonas sp. LH128 TaxID=473781 RepID=UPI00027CB205|nr:extensin family protein [Sphingomonas sp. LH128]EJU12095.1 hypothetical protein LH128_15511 [Sphingomonas sp. LH128]